MDLEGVWELREEEIYPSLFGPVSRGIFPLTQEFFARRFGQTDIDPRWLFLGVFEFAPTPDRDSWLYVTSGYSNPWEQEPDDYDPDGESGSGVEFTFAVAEQGDWAIEALQAMLAFDLLLGAGRFPNGDRFSLHDRIPLRAPWMAERIARYGTSCWLKGRTAFRISSFHPVRSFWWASLALRMPSSLSPRRTVQAL